VVSDADFSDRLGPDFQSRCRPHPLYSCHPRGPEKIGPFRRAPEGPRPPPVRWKPGAQADRGLPPPAPLPITVGAESRTRTSSGPPPPGPGRGVMDPLTIPTKTSAPDGWKRSNGGPRKCAKRYGSSAGATPQRPPAQTPGEPDGEFQARRLTAREVEVKLSTSLRYLG